MTFLVRAVLVFIVITFMVTSSAIAQQNSNSDITKSEAAERARYAENGRVLKVEQTAHKYRVKVLKKSGRVVTVDVDKHSGEVKTSKDRD